MTAPQHDHSLGDGVYFAPNDYIGFWWRILIVAIDAVVLLFIFSAFLIIGEMFHGPDNRWEATAFLIWIVVAWLYLTWLKATVGTPGFWLTGARIVNLRGKRPSVLRMTLRMALWLFGPFNFLIDMFWCTFDNDRQTLRDRFAGTYLIRRNAKPVGTGEVHLAYYHAMGFTLMFPWVTRPKSKPAVNSSTKMP